MNQDQVKEKLQKIHKCPVDYTLIFSGKKSKVNGLYRPQTMEIIIHNKNFLDYKGNQNDNLLLYTAIHELAHHVMHTEKGAKGSRAHSQEFWATFHGLLDDAEEKKVYKAEIDADTKKLIEDARSISKQIAELQRELGRVILAIEESCQKNGIRAEDMIERKAQIGRQSMGTAIAAYNMGDEDVGADIQAEAARQRNEDKRNAIIEAGREGKSVAQAKKCNAPTKPVDRKDETVSLVKEKRRLEKTIESLSHRLEEVVEQLESRGEL